MIRKFRIGKNDRGWYLGVPTWWGSWDIIDGLDSFEQAWALVDRKLPCR